MTKWDKLIGMLEAKRSTLVGFKDLVGLFREMDGAHGDMQDIEVLANNKDELSFSRFPCFMQFACTALVCH